jgi:2-phospho-L-lactate guanylyltransferase
MTALLLPVKRPARAKSRLDIPDPALRATLVAAFARDVVEAALACPAVGSVYVVTDDPDLDLPGATRLPDEGDGDLNRALRRAADRVVRTDPGVTVAALCADVPCLQPDDLADALGAPPGPRWFVGDAAGTGTTLLAAAGGEPLDPHFGIDSAAAHTASGAVALTAPLPTLRLDVDTLADLAQARALGLGRHTAGVVSALT